MTKQQLAMIEKQKSKPKMTKETCLKCGRFLTDVNVFFGKKTCGTCEPIHLMHREKNTWEKNDLPF